MLQFLLQRFQNKQLSRGAINDASSHFKRHRRAISRIWQRALDSKENESEAMSAPSQIKGKSGRKVKDYPAEMSLIPSIPICKRGSLRSLSAASGIPKTALARKLKEGSVRRHTNAIKPLLTENNKKQRIEHCLSFIRSDARVNGMFAEMFDQVHVDEKWFYLSRANQRPYLLKDEEEPLRSCKSKRFMTKVMVLSAVARPRYDHAKKRNV